MSSGPLLLVCIRQRFTHREMLAIHRAQDELRTTQGRHAVMVVVGTVRTELSERARSIAKQTTDEFTGDVVCVAHVVEATGFVGAAIRCVMAGMRVFNQPKHPIREFATVRGAAMWMEPLMREAGLELDFDCRAASLHEWVTVVRSGELEPPRYAGAMS